MKNIQNYSSQRWGIVCLLLFWLVCFYRNITALKSWLNSLSGHGESTGKSSPWLMWDPCSFSAAFTAVMEDEVGAEGHAWLCRPNDFGTRFSPQPLSFPSPSCFTSSAGCRRSNAHCRQRSESQEMGST